MTKYRRLSMVKRGTENSTRREKKQLKYQLKTDEKPVYLKVIEPRGAKSTAMCASVDKVW